MAEEKENYGPYDEEQIGILKKVEKFQESVLDDFIRYNKGEEPVGELFKSDEALVSAMSLMKELTNNTHKVALNKTKFTEVQSNVETAEERVEFIKALTEEMQQAREKIPDEEARTFAPETEKPNFTDGAKSTGIIKPNFTDIMKTKIGDD